MTDSYATYFNNLMDKALAGGVSADIVQGVKDDYDAYYASGKTTVYSSPEFNALEMCMINGGGVFSLYGVMLAQAHNLVNLCDWLTEMGIQWKNLQGIVGYPWPYWSGVEGGKNGEGYFDLFSSYIKSDNLPIEIIGLTPAKEFIYEGDTVVGVTGTCDDGTVYNVHSANGVLLTTGGFSGNPEMLKQYNKMWNWDASSRIPTTNAYGHTGDGIVMGLAAGGKVTNLQSPMMYLLADAIDYSTETVIGDTGNCLLVNKEGARFVDETLNRYAITMALMKQTDEKAFVISDANNCLITNGVNHRGFDVEALIDRKRLYRADSLEELAQLMGCEASALTKTIDDSNKCVDENTDATFGRTVFTDASYIKTPPFYASPRTWAAHITIGGLITDENYGIVKEDGTVVKGLYAAGEVANGTNGVGVMAMVWWLPAPFSRSRRILPHSLVCLDDVISGS